MKKQIICLDFDGVIHSYTSGWKGPRNIPDPPVPGAIEFIGQAIIEGYDVVINSSRSSYWGGISAMRNYIKDHSEMLWYDSPAGAGICNVRFSKKKPPAAVMIDDRAVRFEGTFLEPGEYVKMKPWNKK